MSNPIGSSASRTSLAPWLSVGDGAKAAEFYKNIFQAREVYRLESREGIVSRLEIGDSEFWVADESPEHQNVSPVPNSGAAVRFILTVADPDAVCARAIENGAIEVYAVGEGHGWRLGRIIDPFGHHWEIGHPLS